MLVKWHYWPNTQYSFFSRREIPFLQSRIYPNPAGGFCEKQPALRFWLCVRTPWRGGGVVVTSSSTPEHEFYTFKEPRNRFQGIDSASLCSPAGRYVNPFLAWFLAPIDCSKIPANSSLRSWTGGQTVNSKTVRIRIVLLFGVDRTE